MKRIVGIILIVVGVLLYLFFRNYDGNFLPYPTLWFFIGIILAIIGFKLFVTSKSKTEKEIEESYQSEIKRLKENGDKISVEFKDCEIVSSNYHVELPKSSNYRVQAWDSLYDNGKSAENIEINQSRIIYKNENSEDNNVFISPLINKDEITLSFRLSNYKSTVIYVDKLDKDLYYFDLELLDE
ncbi:hypothetical protein [Marinifilum caeruleilacunae]|uniref:Uncharacterized protein n=1 Tax=Marinifilum caeruleilacunae TaxID=2499076 RepID=A0ABX1WUJ5_9BACT|nr:hypothetical protein [Marinifilum caeruleilacunae]NOU59614.1 hypothetical protein [Marinifilum caeruleilacunae]